MNIYVIPAKAGIHFFYIHIFFCFVKSANHRNFKIDSRLRGNDILRDVSILLNNTKSALILLGENNADTD